MNLKLHSPKALFFLCALLLWVAIYLFNRIQLEFSNPDKQSYVTQVNSYKGEWGKTNELREYVYKNTPWSSPTLNIKDKIWNKNTKEIFSLYKKNLGGVDCSGIATTLMKVYGDYGYEAYTYHSGLPSSKFTHVVTLVRINYKNTKRLIVQDPTFNITFIDAKGEPLDFYQMLKYIKYKEFNKFKILQRDDLPHTYFCSDYDKSKKLCGNDYMAASTAKRIRGNITVLSERVYLNTVTEFIQTYLTVTEVNSSNRWKYPEDAMMRNIKKVLAEI